MSHLFNPQSPLMNILLVPVGVITYLWKPQIVFLRQICRYSEHHLLADGLQASLPNAYPSVFSPLKWEQRSVRSHRVIQNVWRASGGWQVLGRWTFILPRTVFVLRLGQGRRWPRGFLSGPWRDIISGHWVMDQRRTLVGFLVLHVCVFHVFRSNDSSLWAPLCVVFLSRKWATEPPNPSPDPLAVACAEVSHGCASHPTGRSGSAALKHRGWAARQGVCLCPRTLN